MCKKLAEKSSGPAKYVCGGLYVGRCSLVQKMLRLVDEVIEQDGASASFFDQALYQIMQLRYPELNIQVDSERRFLHNLQGFGDQSRKEKKATQQEYERLYNITEKEVCSVKRGWTEIAKFREKMGKELMFMHFNGDSKIPVLVSCTHFSHYRPKQSGPFITATLGVRDAFWINPELEAVVNCPDTPVAQVMYVDRSNTLAQHARTDDFRKKILARLKLQKEKMAPAWYAQRPFAFNRDPCVQQRGHESTCPEDATRKGSEGDAAYVYKPPSS